MRASVKGHAKCLHAWVLPGTRHSGRLGIVGGKLIKHCARHSLRRVEEKRDNTLLGMSSKPHR